MSGAWSYRRSEILHNDDGERWVEEVWLLVAPDGEEFVDVVIRDEKDARRLTDSLNRSGVDTGVAAMQAAEPTRNETP